MNAALGVATRLRSHRGVALLHSARNDDGCGQWSFVACDPVRVVEVYGQTISLYDRSGVVRERFDGDPLNVLQELVHEHTRRWVDKTEGPVPVAIGYLGYDLGRQIEGFRAGKARSVDNAPDMWFGLYDAVWRFDENTRKSDIIGKSAGARRSLAEAIARGDDTLKRPPVFDPLVPHSVSGSASQEKAEYARRIQRILEYVRAGDVYQVNIARRLTADIRVPGDPMALYAALMRNAPASFGAYLCTPFGEQDEVLHFMSGSPERFLYRTKGSHILETRPIKGTRRRTGDIERDRQLAEELANDEKERAEHLMIVDLERNDLGKVAELGTVRVEDMAKVIELPHLYHLVSRITCQLRTNIRFSEILQATFPGGSITGAPKIRAMEIIDELEPTRRGIYTGAVGYFGLGNALDLSIAIRTAMLDKERLVLHVGGGIVADSTAEREFEETEEKAAGWRKTLNV